ncbi:MAG: hypothetical protein H6827_09775 [Planctomycetes bacterium]|nr:hypothetical protein [Planctomycetota bacterium]
MKSLRILIALGTFVAAASAQDTAATGGGLPAPPAPSVTLIYRDVPVIDPSWLSVEFGKHDPFLAFSLNQGLEIKLASWFKLGGAYSGAYDFRTDAHSGPVVSQKQNPSMFLAFSGTSGSPIWSIPLGWAHESNGMFITNQQEFQGFTGLRPDSCKAPLSKCKDLEAQDYASMGWDYLWIRGFITNATRKNRHELVFNASVEYRMYIQEGFGFGEEQLEDTAIFIHNGNPVGYRHYDGIRLSLGASYENISLQTFGKFGTEAPIMGSGGAILSYRLPEEIRKTYPVEPFVSFETGYGLSLARYFESNTRVNVGVIVRNPVIHAFYD